MIQKVAFALIFGGVLAATGYYFYWFFSTSEIALGFRIAIAVVISGIILLLSMVIWQRLQAAKDENFKEVKY